ncbi:MAG TPA: hypothetical protein VFZ82_16570 [Methylomirabilota bacterium]|nr:hypothetical protein [Methylomirabilota bacterium]
MSSSPKATVRYLVLIYLEPGQRDGAFERIWSPVGADQAPDTPDEIHLLRFDSETGLEATRRDPEMQALAGLRGTVVRKAVLVRVADVPLGPYFADPA